MNRTSEVVQPAWATIDKFDVPGIFFNYRHAVKLGDRAGVQVTVKLIAATAAMRCRALHAGWALPSLLLVILLSGCVALKNPVPEVPQPTVAAGWKTRYAFSVWVRTPIQNGFKGETNAFDPSAEAQYGACRLADILSRCRLFQEVVVSNSAPGSNVVMIEALPNAPPYADPDEAWLMLYGGVIPVYDCVDEGVRFRFVNGGTNDFVFPRTTESVIGFWVPFVAAVGPGWRFGWFFNWRSLASDSPYWSDLRSSLIQAMDRNRTMQNTRSQPRKN
jgi:hypothetical protein